MFGIAHRMTNLLQHSLVLLVHFEVTEYSEIIPAFDASQMCAHVVDERSLAAESGGVLWVGEKLHAILVKDRLFGRQGTGLLVFRGQLASFDFAGLNIRLVECVDADD